MGFWTRGESEPASSFVEAKFRPRDDITAYELAQIVAKVNGLSPPCNGVRFPIEIWSTLDETLKRHFVV